MTTLGKAIKRGNIKIHQYCLRSPSSHALLYVQSYSTAFRCVIHNCCFSVLKNPPLRLKPLPVAFPWLFQNSSPHPLPQKAAPDTSRLPTQMPLQANIPTLLFWAQLALVPSLSKLSGLPLLYFWEGNSVSGPTSAAHPQVSNCPVWAVDNLEVTAKILPWKMWWETLEDRQKSCNAPEDGWSWETLWWIQFEDKSLWCHKSWPSLTFSLDPSLLTSLCICEEVINLHSSIQSLKPVKFLLILLKAYLPKYASIVTFGVLGQQL